MATQIRSDEMWEKDCQAYDEVRKTCDAFKQKNIDGQDKMVMSISSALFGILLAIFDKDLLIKSQISSCWCSGGRWAGQNRNAWQCLRSWWDRCMIQHPGGFEKRVENTSEAVGEMV